MTQSTRAACPPPLVKCSYGMRILPGAPQILSLYFCIDCLPNRTEKIVSHQDTKFFNTFTLVIGLLIAVTLAILPWPAA